jgi:hypothetical protein
MFGRGGTVLICYTKLRGAGVFYHGGVKISYIKYIGDDKRYNNTQRDYRYFLTFHTGTPFAYAKIRAYICFFIMETLLFLSTVM